MAGPSAEAQAVIRRWGAVFAYHQSLAALVLFGCTGGQPGAPPGPAQDEVQSWHTCRVAADCIWTIGAAGWPVAVNAAALPAYHEWIQSQAPFTTYFMPGDCFAHDGEFEAYVSRTESSVVCVDEACALEVDPNCTK